MAGVSDSGSATEHAPHEVRQEADTTEPHERTAPEPGTAAAGLNTLRYPKDTAEIAKELVVDLRAELPRIDARAAAGTALAAAVLVSVVSQAPREMPIYAFGVVAAVLLTIALFLFLMVLLPTPTLPSHRSLVMAQKDGAVRRRRRRDAEVKKLEDMGRQLAAELTGLNRTEYYATVAIQIGAQVRAKQRLLLCAFVSGALSVAALALGATWALHLGWR